jgi:hypothetical protein
MTETPAAWVTLIDAVERWVVPSWVANARAHGEQPWIRLVLIVDAHAMLAAPQPTEKIAMTMADLAEGPEREGERAGWEALAAHTRDQRLEIAAKIVDAAEHVLPDDLMLYFERSVEPTAHYHP